MTQSEFFTILIKENNPLIPSSTARLSYNFQRSVQCWEESCCWGLATLSPSLSFTKSHTPSHFGNAREQGTIFARDHRTRSSVDPLRRPRYTCCTAHGHTAGPGSDPRGWLSSAVWAIKLHGIFSSKSRWYHLAPCVFGRV